MNKPLKIIVFTLLAIFYGSFLIHKIELPVADDMARHVKNGELILQGNFDVLYENVYSYIEPEHPFVYHNWLSGIIFYLLHQAVGWDGLVIFKVIVLLLTFSLLFLVSLKKANFWLVAIFSIPTVFILGERTALRPEIFSYLFTATFLYLLIDLDEHPKRKRIFWLIPIQLLWANMHLFFIIGIAFVGGFLLEKVILNRTNLRGNPLVKKLAVILLILVAVSFINPNGIQGALYPLQIFNNYGANVAENQSPSYFLRLRPPLDNLPINIFFWSVLFLAVSFIFNLKKLSTFYLLASVATIIGGFKMLRLLSFFGMIFLPAVSANFNPVFQTLRSTPTNRIAMATLFVGDTKISRYLKGFFIAIFVILLVSLIGLGYNGRFSNYKKPGIGLTAMSNRSAEFFKEHNLKGPIFNDYDIGSYLIYHLYPVKSGKSGPVKSSEISQGFDGVNPQEKIFVDNRPEAYSASFFNNTYYPIFQSENKWQEVLGKYKFNVIYFYQYDQAVGLRQFLYNRIHDPLWSLIYADTYAFILVKNSPENLEIVNRFKINSENAVEKLKSLVESEDYEDRVAATDIFNYLERSDLGMKTFLQIVEKWPQKGKIWMVMGECESKTSPSLAVTYLEKAISVGHKTAEAYYFLGLAYKNMGEYDKATTALTKALKINPDRQDAKELLKNIGSGPI